MTLDHFKFYRLQETESDLSVDINVGLRGQFDLIFRPANLSELLLFATPVDKNNEGIISDDNHMTIYDFAVNTPEPERILTVSNQFFANTPLRIGDGIGLMVPAQKINPGNHAPPQNLDHYKLYRVLQGESPEATVTLNDQFGNDNNEVRTPVLFGVPVAKSFNGNIEPINNEVDHLVIYQILPRNIAIDVRSNDQFGTFDFRARRARFLAVPTLKLTVDGDPVVQPG